MSGTAHGWDSPEDGADVTSVWSWSSDICFDDGQMGSGAVAKQAGKDHFQPILHVCPWL